MADIFSPEKRREFMSNVKTTGTKPEQLVRQYLFRQGFRYRKNVKKLPGKPDLVLKKYASVVFVNGCFWHAHEGCKDFVVPKTRTEWWLKKLEGNVTRDRENCESLEAIGWHVYTVWECDIKHDFDNTMGKLVDNIRSHRLE